MQLEQDDNRDRLLMGEAKGEEEAAVREGRGRSEKGVEGDARE